MSGVTGLTRLCHCLPLNTRNNSMYRLEDEDLELGRPHRIAACPLALPGSSLTASTVPPLPAPEFLQSITASWCVLPRCLPSLRTASINFFEDGAAVKGGKAACILLVPKLRSYHVYMPRYDTQASDCSVPGSRNVAAQGPQHER